MKPRNTVADPADWSEPPDLELKLIRERATIALTEHEHARRTLKTERKARDTAKDHHDAAREAQRILQGIAQSVQKAAHGRIAKIVSRCLSAVFEAPYDLRVRFEERRGKTEAVLVLYRGGIELDDPLNEAGGGVIAVACLAARLADLSLSNPPQRLFVALDEPFLQVDMDNRRRIRAMVAGLVAELDVQFLIATNEPDLEMGSVISVNS